MAGLTPRIFDAALALRRSLLVALCASALPRGAVAQDAQREIARGTLLEQAERAFARGDHAAALRLAEQAGETRMTPSVLLLIAQEHNTLGHTLDALAAVERCLRAAEADSAVPQRREILSIAGRLRDSLRARVSFVTLRTPPDMPDGLRVQVQGVEVSPAFWGVPYAVLPGGAAITASGPGGVFEQRVMLDAGRETAVTVVLTPRPVLRPAPPAAPAPAPGPLHAASSWLLAEGRTPVPIIVLGSGAALLGASLVLAVLRANALHDRDQSCPMARCDMPGLTAALADNDRAVTYNALTNVTLGLGLSGVILGGAWLLLARTAAPAPARRALRWQVAPSPSGLSLTLGGPL